MLLLVKMWNLKAEKSEYDQEIPQSHTADQLSNANPDYSYNNDIKCQHGETFYGKHAAQTQESWHQKVSMIRKYHSHKAI